MERTIALIVAAGSGIRAGGGVPKQYAPVAGRPMIAYSHGALSAHPDIAGVIVVIGEGQHRLLEAAVGDVPSVVGGATRRESVARGLDAARAVGATRVLIHDAARPFLPAAVIDRVIAALHTHDGATPVLPVADTLARGGDTLEKMVPRAGLSRVQTPQGFRLDLLDAAHAAWPPGEEATDDAQMVRRLGGSVALVQGDAMLDKVTYPEDFALAEARAALETRTAMGFDVHRLEEGEELWLGGILIPHDKGLSGHSDADVALHALTDALLGTIAAGDIGTHFPPSDPQWKGADSAQFLQHAASLIAQRGGRIGFVDLTIMCEAPKIGPHRAAMTQRIADLLALSPDRVSVKATTTERLGFTGRGEGIAAQAVATIQLPSVRLPAAEVPEQ
jgi:2-C-methyl-D-erythritol 4-phosphate cytidylyltransferase/2-C-methyl-D-erythritol 2,4-cyclodiphosphate synthase